MPVVVFSPDSRFVLSWQWVGEERGTAVVEGETHVLVWETSTGRRLAEIREPGRIENPKFSPDGNRILLERTKMDPQVKNPFTRPVSESFRLVAVENVAGSAPWCKLNLPTSPKTTGPGFLFSGSTELIFNCDGSRLLHVPTESIVDPATGRVVGTFGPGEAEPPSGLAIRRTHSRPAVRVLAKSWCRGMAAAARRKRANRPARS